MRTENLFKDEQLMKIQNEKSQIEISKQVLLPIICFFYTYPCNEFYINVFIFKNEIRELNEKLSEVQRILGQQQYMEEVTPIAIGHFDHVENYSIIVTDDPGSSDSDTDMLYYQPDFVSKNIFFFSKYTVMAFFFNQMFRY